MRRKITHEENGGIMIILRLILIPFILLAGCFLFVTNALPDEKAQNESLGKLIAEALENNLQIAAVYNEWKAAEYKISSERSLPDPEARYSRFGEEVQTRVGPQENKYGASVKVPFPAKLIYRGKAQSARADMLGEKYESIKREVIRNVKFIVIFRDPVERAYSAYWHRRRNMRESVSFEEAIQQPGKQLP